MPLLQVNFCAAELIACLMCATQSRMFDEFHRKRLPDIGLSQIIGFPVTYSLVGCSLLNSCYVPARASGLCAVLQQGLLFLRRGFSKS